MSKVINVAIDGPAGAGKSSVSKKVATDIGFIYVDTGALYRAIALYTIENKLEMTEEIIKNLDKIDLKLMYENGMQHVVLNGRDVSGEIRTPEVSKNASRVSAIPEVRKFLLNLQKDIAENNNIIMDGRDIGTVILPNADLKIYLTASVEERAKRRYEEMKTIENCPSLEEICEDIKKRDYSDMHRETAPLKRADDAVEVDSSDLSFDEVTAIIENMIREILQRKIL